MDEDGHLAQVYVSEGVRPCRYRLQLAKDCFYGASSPKIPDITMLRSGHRICYTVLHFGSLRAVSIAVRNASEICLRDLSGNTLRGR